MTNSIYMLTYVHIKYTCIYLKHRDVLKKALRNFSYFQLPLDIALFFLSLQLLFDNKGNIKQLLTVNACEYLGGMV